MSSLTFYEMVLGVSEVTCSHAFQYQTYSYMNQWTVLLHVLSVTQSGDECSIWKSNGLVLCWQVTLRDEMSLQYIRLGMWHQMYWLAGETGVRMTAICGGDASHRYVMWKIVENILTIIVMLIIVSVRNWCKGSTVQGTHKYHGLEQ